MDVQTFVKVIKLTVSHCVMFSVIDSHPVEDLGFWMMLVRPVGREKTSDRSCKADQLHSVWYIPLNTARSQVPVGLVATHIQS